MIHKGAMKLQYVPIDYHVTNILNNPLTKGKFEGKGSCTSWLMVQVEELDHMLYAKIIVQV